MEKIVMLGTGHGLVWKLYNTCFIFDNNGENLLVDTGGGAEIIKRIEQAGYRLADIHNIFISHCHTDHILGLLWLFKGMLGRFKKGDAEKLNIFCNIEVKQSIEKLYTSVFSLPIIKAIEDNIVIHVLEDGETLKIAGETITFFDAHPKGNQLFGFETVLSNGKKIVFLGDETCNPILYDRIKDADFVMHEAFCLDEEETLFKAYEKHHSTVKSTCVEMDKLNIANLILYHTEETHDNKKELYINEAKQYFKNNVIVPNDLETIILD